MAGREEALQRARARRKVDSHADPLAAAESVSDGALAAFGGVAGGAAAGYLLWDREILDRMSPGVRKGLVRDELEARLPGYDLGFADDLTDLANTSTRIKSYLGEGGNINFYTPNRTDVPTFKDIYGKDYHEVSRELRAGGLGWDEALNKVHELEKDVPLDKTDWNLTRFYNSSLPRRGYPTATIIPEPGPDLGGFRRGWNGPDENALVYTAVPNVNSGRFSQRLLPAMIDRVYGRDGRAWRKPEDWEGWEPGNRRPIPKPDIAKADEPWNTKIPAKPDWDQLEPGERVWHMDRMAPGQSYGKNVSGYIWGTEYEYPRYQYIDEPIAQVPGKPRASGGNPEIVVSSVRTLPELESGYGPTSRFSNPYIQYQLNELGVPRKEAPYVIGPSWGRSNETGGANIAGTRPRRDSSGDILFRSDLIERRGGFSLADAQAVQSKLGLPLTMPNDRLTPGQAMEQAIESIRVKEGLESHGAVVDRYARRLPNLGRTTAPRQPAQGVTYLSDVETAVQFPQAVQRAVDLPGALERAGLPPTPRSVDTVNTAAREAAEGRIRGMQNVGRALPVVGALSGFADPGVTGPLGAMTRTSDPGERLNLAGDAGRAYASSGLLGAGVGAALSAGLRGIASRAPVAATRLVAGGTAAAPALAVMGAADAADAYLQGATGAGLKQHWQSFQDQGTNRGASQVLPELLPQARSVPANTPSGTARLTRTVPQNPVAREIRNRAALARRNFDPVRGDFGVSEVLFGRGGQGPRRTAPVPRSQPSRPQQANPLQRAWGQLDSRVFGGWLPGGAARPGRGGRR